MIISQVSYRTNGPLVILYSSIMRASIRLSASDPQPSSHNILETLSYEEKLPVIHLAQRSGGRQIRRPGTRKLGLGRIILPTDDSRDARFFRREMSQNAYLYSGFIVY